MLMRALLAAVALLGIVGVLGAADPAYDLGVKKASDAITAAKDGDKTVFTIISPSGIGSGSIVLKEGQWTKEIVLRFHHTKTEPFKDLEQFTLKTDRIKVEGSRKQSKAMPFYLADADGKFAATPAGTLEIIVEANKEYVEVKFPANLFIGSKTVELTWIDFLR